MQNSIKINPTPGNVYRNKNGTDYICLGHDLYQNGSYVKRLPIMQCVKQSFGQAWTFFAHDIVQYSDGTIEWARSTHGRFENP